MKRFLFTFILVSITMGMYSQTQRFFCEIKGTENGFTSGLMIVFDFGTNPVYSAWGGLSGKQKLVDESGKEIPFNSMVDAGNYMSSKGWSFQQAYTSVYRGAAIIHWIFYKDAESPEQAVKGIMTKEAYKKQEKKQ